MSDHSERACQVCGSLLHHEDDGKCSPASPPPATTATTDDECIEVMPDGSRYRHADDCPGFCDYACGDFEDAP